MKPALSHRPEKNRGAVFTEFAVVFPLFLFIVYFFFEVARYMSVYSALNAGADQAVTLAAKVPGLESATNSQAYARARTVVMQRSIRAAQSSLVSAGLNNGMATLTADPQLILPAPVGGTSQEQAFEQEPIRIVLQAEVRPVLQQIAIPFMSAPLRFPTLPIRITASAFREQAKTASVPVPVDCNGYPQGSEYYKSQPCPCSDPLAYWSMWDDQCICNWPATMQNNQCVCPDGLVAVAGSCECPSKEALGCNGRAEVSTVWNYDPSSGWEQGCECSCPEGFTTDGSGGCTCPGNQSEVEDSCECTNTCTGGRSVTDASCACNCPWYAPESGGSCQCSDTKRQFNTTTAQCDCKTQPSSCAAPKTLNLDSCECQCPTGPGWTTNSSGDCVCREPYVRDGNSCRCNTSFQCGANATLSSGGSTCECRCRTGFTGNAYTGCSCPAPRQVLSNGTCGCAGSGEEFFDGRCVQSTCASYVRAGRCRMDQITSNGQCAPCPNPTPTPAPTVAPTASPTPTGTDAEDEGG